MNKAVDYLDELLGRVTMYRQLIYGLSTIAAVAFGLMLTGYMPYSPVSFVMSVVLFVGVSYGSNRLFGWLFGVNSHGESAIITGLILSLLFTPAITILIGVKLALVAIIAMASKYIITIRNRHIFNPAAIAIVIASISKLAFATWWIATPALLPVTIIVSGLILFKVRRLQMAGVFLAVSVGLIVLTAIVNGGTTSQTVVLAITSWPLFFFAGIMLCEPLTLPPRKKQQFFVAGLVGILLASSFHFGPITMTPALALVIGNLVSWIWSTRRSIKLRFVAKKQMGLSAYDFTFDTNKISFEPGQYIEITLPHRHVDSRGTRRVFSIVGRSESEQIAIGTKLPEKPSSFKRTLLGLKSGQTVYATRIAGDFVLPKDKTVPLVFIAGGIGITPFVSLVMAAEKRDITLVYIVSSAADMAYVHELSQYDIKGIVISPDAIGVPQAWRHIQAGSITSEIVAEIISSNEAAHVYISGAPGMVNKVKNIVKRLGVKNIKTDHFAGY